jgi:hypothetical protein
MADFEDDFDARKIPASGYFDSSMDQWLSDRFGASETKQSVSGFQDYLDSRFPRTSGPVEIGPNIQEYFAALKKRR